MTTRRLGPRFARFTRFVGLVAVGAALAGCAIPVSGTPHLLPKSDVPEALTQRPEQANPQPNKATSKQVSVYIYLIQSITQNLVPVTRYVAPPPTVQKVLDELEVGPLSADYHVGDESAISPTSHLVAVGPVVKGTATIRLDDSFIQANGENAVDELAQIVWSVTRTHLGVRQIHFVGPNGPISVEIATGRFVSRPVSQKDYQLVATPSS